MSIFDLREVSLGQPEHWWLVDHKVHTLPDVLCYCAIPEAAYQVYETWLRFVYWALPNDNLYRELEEFFRERGLAVCPGDDMWGYLVYEAVPDIHQAELSRVPDAIPYEVRATVRGYGSSPEQMVDILLSRLPQYTMVLNGQFNVYRYSDPEHVEVVRRSGHDVH